MRSNLHNLLGNSISFSLVRDGDTINDNIKGFFCSSKYPKTIQSNTNEAIHDGDILIDKSNTNKYIIDNARHIDNEFYMLHYYTPTEAALRQQPTSINVNTIQGNAIVGNQGNATMNIGASFDEIRQTIAKQSMSPQDREDLNKLVAAVEAAINNNMTLSNGIFQKYSHLLKEHEGLVVAIAQPVIHWLLGV